MFAVMYSKTLVFPADEDGRDNVTTARNLLGKEIFVQVESGHT
jgi:hypothetical protein